MRKDFGHEHSGKASGIADACDVALAESAIEEEGRR